ncbi:MAG: formate dehydrogenase subunit gamma [Candidatus Methylomirabilales bacterium]
MRWRGWIIITATLLAGLSVVVGAWGYFTVSPKEVITPGGFEVWGTLRPGEAWEGFWVYRDGLRYYGAALFLLTAALVLLHYAAVGPDTVSASGRTVQRFRWREVLTHAALTFSFLVLWVSGLYLILSRLFLERPAPFWGRMASAAHIWGGLVFVVALVATWLQWRRDMRFVSYDRAWLRRAGGYLSREHPHLPAGRFNAGQKIWFQATLLLGVVLGVTGLLLYYPGGLGLTPSVQVVLYVIHTVGAVAMVSGVVVHFYLATVAIPGTLKAMLTGRMDENLIKVHHPESRPAREASSPA